MTSLKRLLFVVALPLVFGGIVFLGFHGYERYQFRRAMGEADTAAQAGAAEDRARLQKALDLVDGNVPPSAWEEAGQAPFVQAATEAKSAIVVLPASYSKSGHPLDASARVTIARLVAAAIAEEEGRVADPGILFRALGDAREYTAAAVNGLATGSRWIVTIDAWHDNQGSMQLQFEKRTPAQLGGKEASARYRTAATAIDRRRTPEAAFAPIARTVVEKLGLRVRAAATRVTESKAPTLPASPMQEGMSAAGSTEGLWLQQLIGVLHPVAGTQYDARAQERVFERTLAALLADEAGDQSDRALLLARAYAYLGRRSAALATIRAMGAKSPEGEALDALLMADLPRLQASIRKIGRDVPRLLAELEAIKLAFDLGLSNQGGRRRSYEDLAAKVPEAWRPLVGFFVFGMDPWDYPAPGHVKPLLEQAFPVPGYAWEEVARAKAALGAGAYDGKLEVEFMLSPIVHARKWRTANTAALCCSSSPETWSAYQAVQYLDLLETIAGDLAYGRLEFLTSYQGRPEDALRLADLYDEVLFGGTNPSVAHRRAQAAANLQRQPGSAPHLAALAATAFENARRVSAWRKTQSVEAMSAREIQHWTKERMLEARGFAMQYRRRVRLPVHPGLWEFPRRYYWSLHSLGAPSEMAQAGRRQQLLAENCEDTITQAALCIAYVELLEETGDASVDAAVRTNIENRFIGSARRVSYLIERRRKAGDREGMRTVAKEAAALPGASAGLFGMLGKVFMEDGDFAEAGRALLAFPGLKDGSRHVVEVSNYAYDAGYQLARRGAFAEAQPLLGIAAANADGSGSSHRAAIILAADRGDYARAIEIAQGSYQRYQQTGTLRVLGSLFFLAGQAEAGWSVLEQTSPQSADMSPLRAGEVGLRMAQSDAVRRAEWASGIAKPGSPAAVMLSRAAGGVIARVAMVDRMPASVRGVGEEIIALSFPVQLARAPGRDPAFIKKLVSMQPEMAELRHYAEGYAAFVERHHEQAADKWETLQKQADKYGMPTHILGNFDSHYGAMPYFAFSLMKLGREAEARDLPQRWSREGRDQASKRTTTGKGQDPFPAPEFDRAMTRAVVHALGGRHDEAAAELRRARGNIPTEDQRLLPAEYVYAEICEALTKETREARYLDMALEFARGHRRFEPWAAWAWAFEARHTTDAAQRTKAAGMALHLDPASERLRAIDEPTLAAARAWLKVNSPAQRRSRETAGADRNT